jgi:hypothetical protein
MRADEKRKVNAARLLKEATVRHRPVHVVHPFESTGPVWERRRRDLYPGRDQG